MAYLGIVSFYSYFTTIIFIIIFNNVFFRFRPFSVSSSVSNVIAIGNMGAN